MSDSLNYITRPPKIKIENPPLLIMLHGYGSHEKDLFSFANELPDELFIISVQAPISISFGGYAWYSIHFNEHDASKFSDVDEAEQALALLDIFIDDVKQKYSPKGDTTFLLGFSQGTILSMAYALNHPDKVNYVIGLSGYIFRDIIKNTTFKNFDHLDFFVSHGTEDQVIPVEWARKTAPYLTNLGISNQYKEYPVGHGVAPQNFYDLQAWIQLKL